MAKSGGGLKDGWKQRDRRAVGVDRCHSDLKRDMKIKAEAFKNCSHFSISSSL